MANLCGWSLDVWYRRHRTSPHRRCHSWSWRFCLGSKHFIPSGNIHMYVCMYAQMYFDMYFVSFTSSSHYFYADLYHNNHFHLGNYIYIYIYIYMKNYIFAWWRRNFRENNVRKLFLFLFYIYIYIYIYIITLYFFA
jgi:hypothetical protein